MLAGHTLGYQLAISDPHARADALAHSGHDYFSYVPFALSVCLGVLLVGLALQAISAFRGEPRRPATSPVIVLLSPVAFMAQELIERLAHSGDVSLMTALQPAFLIGLALQLPFALAALLLAWALDSAARAVGEALASVPRPTFHVLVAVPVRIPGAPSLRARARLRRARASPSFADRRFVERRSSLKRASVAIAVVLAALAAAPSAFGHATLQQSTPGNNSIVRQSPPEVTLQFSEAVETAFGSIRVYDCGGTRVDSGRSAVRPTARSQWRWTGGSRPGPTPSPGA